MYEMKWEKFYDDMKYEESEDKLFEIVKNYENEMGFEYV